MPKHEFGIMPEEPSYTARFDVYEPQKYDCITIDDDLIEPILEDLGSIDSYIHTRQRPGKGLVYCGITMIPPESLNTFIKIYLIHFGV